MFLFFFCFGGEGGIGSNSHNLTFVSFALKWEYVIAFPEFDMLLLFVSIDGNEPLFIIYPKKKDRL